MSKEELIIETAKTLFFKYGLKKVPIEEIVSEAGISKATFYHYFSNKSDLAKMVLQALFEADKLEFQRILESDTGFEEKIQRLVEFHESKFEERSDSFYYDIARNFPELNEVLLEHRNRMYDFVSGFLVQNQQNGNIRQSLDVKFISEAIIFITESAMKGDLGHNFTSKSELLRQLTNLFFYGILEKHT